MTNQVYVRLIDEGVDVWRPAQMKEAGPGLFQLLATAGYDPEDEQWEFPPGSIVRCARKKLQDGFYLVAIERVR